jgi:hypothetical protein
MSFYWQREACLSPPRAEQFGIAVKNSGKYQIARNVRVDLIQYSLDRVAGHEPAIPVNYIRLSKMNLKTEIIERLFV